MVRYKFHHGETNKRYGRRDRKHMGKEWRTGDKECGSLLDKDANRVNLNWNR